MLLSQYFVTSSLQVTHPQRQIKFRNLQYMHRLIKLKVSALFIDTNDNENISDILQPILFADGTNLLRFIEK